MEQNCYGYRMFTGKYYSSFKHRKQIRSVETMPCCAWNLSHFSNSIFNIAKACFAELWLLGACTYMHQLFPLLRLDAEQRQLFWKQRREWLLRWRCFHHPLCWSLEESVASQHGLSLQLSRRTQPRRGLCPLQVRAKMTKAKSISTARLIELINKCIKCRNVGCFTSSCM